MKTVQSCGAKFQKFTETRLERFNEMQRFFKEEKVTRLKFNAYIRRGRELNKMFDLLSPRREKSLVFVGNPTTMHCATVQKDSCGLLSTA